jgi:hypothetical protein
MDNDLRLNIWFLVQVVWTVLVVAPEKKEEVKMVGIGWQWLE